MMVEDFTDPHVVPLSISVAAFTPVQFVGLILEYSLILTRRLRLQSGNYSYDGHYWGSMGVDVEERRKRGYNTLSRVGG